MPKIAPAISIALCTYNGAKFLPAQLESLAAQTRPPDELVVGDDCSSDETIQILKDFAARAAFPVRVAINDENLGSTRNFEQTILRCRGDIVFLSDQDDVWLPDKIARAWAEFERDENVGMVFTDAEIVDENLNSLGRQLWDFSFSPQMRQIARQKGILEVLFRQSTVTGATMAFRSRFVDSFVPIPVDIPRVIHDEWIALVVALQAKVIFLEESSIKYRQHSSQQLGVVVKEIESESAEIYDGSLRWLGRRKQKLAALKSNLLGNRNLRNAETEAKINSFASDQLSEIRAHISHLEFRKNMSRARLKRAAEIWSELKTRRYQRFSKGFLSAAKDLLRNSNELNEISDEQN